MEQKETKPKVKLYTATVPVLLSCLIDLLDQSEASANKESVLRVRAFLNNWRIAEATCCPVQYLDCLGNLLNTVFTIPRPSSVDYRIDQDLGYFPIEILEDQKDALMTTIAYSKKAIKDAEAVANKFERYYLKQLNEDFKKAQVEARVKCLKEMKGRLLLVADDGDGFYALDNESLRLVQEYVKTRLDSIKNKPEPETKEESPYIKGTEKLIKTLRPFLKVEIK